MRAEDIRGRWVADPTGFFPWPFQCSTSVGCFGPTVYPSLQVESLRLEDPTMGLAVGEAGRTKIAGRMEVDLADQEILVRDLHR